jgi:hypothetical protein
MRDFPRGGGGGLARSLGSGEGGALGFSSNGPRQCPTPWGCAQL